MGHGIRDGQLYPDHGTVHERRWRDGSAAQPSAKTCWHRVELDSPELATTTPDRLPDVPGFPHYLQPSDWDRLNRSQRGKNRPEPGWPAPRAPAPYANVCQLSAAGGAVSGRPVPLQVGRAGSLCNCHDRPPAARLVVQCAAVVWDCRPITHIVLWSAASAESGGRQSGAGTAGRRQTRLRC